jgi:hypothetical protein
MAAGAGAVGGSLQSGSALIPGMTILSGQRVVFGVPSIGMGIATLTASGGRGLRKPGDADIVGSGSWSCGMIL